MQQCRIVTAGISRKPGKTSCQMRTLILSQYPFELTLLSMFLILCLQNGESWEVNLACRRAFRRSERYFDQVSHTEQVFPCG